MTVEEKIVVMNARARIKDVSVTFKRGIHVKNDNVFIYKAHEFKDSEGLHFYLNPAWVEAHDVEHLLNHISVMCFVPI